jgi:murein DD-endopeptidase / murein LD-carboxypeptidase
MIRNIFIASLILLIASCSSTKPVSSTATNHKANNVATPSQQTATRKNDIKFLDQISSNPGIAATIPDAKSERKETNTGSAQIKFENSPVPSGDVDALRVKYGGLLGKDPGQIENIELIRSVDEWYGTRYKMGGTSKSGIDCSAFVQAVYLSTFGLMVPRTAFEQFKVASHISATEMREGDLVFFNTTGGVSHVGIYMGNNKFAHASVAHGVTVSDLFDPYYLKRFLGIGRIERTTGTR